MRSSGGVFEISLDGELKFSKKQTGRFPTGEEIEALAKSGAKSGATTSGAPARS